MMNRVTAGTKRARASAARPGRIEPLALRGVVGEAHHVPAFAVGRQFFLVPARRAWGRGDGGGAGAEGLQGEAAAGKRLEGAGQVGHREVVAARLRVAAARRGSAMGRARGVPRGRSAGLQGFGAARRAARRRCRGARARRASVPGASCASAAMPMRRSAASSASLARPGSIRWRSHRAQAAPMSASVSA